MKGQDENYLKKVAEAKTRITEIQPEEVDPLATNGAVILDVRKAGEYEAGHIEGALSVSMSTLSQDIQKIVPDKTQPIICYCNGGNSGALAADELQRLGYVNVTSICGGLKAYTAKVGKVRGRYR